MAAPTPIITLTTDFGAQDHYVACLKGVILQICSKARVIDVTHDIAPQSVMQAAFVLRQVWPWFPPGTIHVAVVDPGVGTRRRIVVGRYSDRFIVTPDNGTVSLVHRDAELQELRAVENRQYFTASLSTTFHGRDILAPVAAHIANGVRLNELGPITDHLEILQLPHTRREGSALVGEVLYVDRFGNLITNINVSEINSVASARHRLEVFLDGRAIGPIQITYSDVPAGQPLALVGSTQMLEVAVNQGNAGQQLGGRVGTPVELR
jgi:S-adenosylmethionine hydrolase